MNGSVAPSAARVAPASGPLASLRRGVPALLTNSLLLFAAMMWFNLCGYLFNVIAGRALGPADYGALAALVAVLQLISVPTTAMQTTAVKFVAERQGDMRGAYGLLVWLVVRVGLTGLLLFSLVLLGSSTLAGLLKIDAVAAVAVMSVMAVLYPLLHLAQGVLRGMGRFGTLSGLIFSEGALKVGLLVVYLSAGLALLGAVSGLVLATLLTCGLAYLLLGRPARERPASFGDGRDLLRYGVPVLLTTVLGALLTNVDLVLARHFLAPEDAGRYAAISLLGKAIFYGSDAVVSAMFPLIATAQGRGEDHRHLLWQAGLMVGSGCGLALAAYFALPGLVLGSLLGPAYADAAPLLGWMGVAAVLFALAHVQMTYALALRRLRYLWPLIAVAILQPVLLSLFHTGPRDIVAVQAVAMLLLAAGVTTVNLYPHFQARVRFLGRDTMPDPSTSFSENVW